MIPVADVASLVAAIGAASPGDEIVLAPGTYAFSGVTCAAMGTEQAPITVRSRDPLGARIDFDGVEGFKVSGANWHFDGLDVVGVCANDDDCEHAFHVTGKADGFVLRDSRVVDFNAQLKVNSAPIDDVWETPDRGRIERVELFDTRARNTGNPTTKLNIDTGDGWIVRDTYLHDFQKGGGDGVSYGAFMKSGGHDGVFERNLVVCDGGLHVGGTRIGLSFGGGGTSPAYCAPAFDASVPCSVEHTDGVMRNNVIVGCSDVGVYVNRGVNTAVVFNTLIGTSGVDFRFDTTTGRAHGNLLDGQIRDRDGGVHVEGTNTVVDAAAFAAAYADALRGDLGVVGEVAAWEGAATPDPDVTDDYCGRGRSPAMWTAGALEHSLGDCEATADTDSDVSGETDDTGPIADIGCGCASPSGPPRMAWAIGLALAIGRARRRFRRGTPNSTGAP